MKQLIQNFKTGELLVSDVPMPQLHEGFVLVANKVSLISAGTEKRTVLTGQASLLGKARKRPDLVKQVMQNIKREGLSSTIQKVRNKLDSPKALGYSSAGIVITSNDTKQYYKPGMRIACAGQDYASHAEYIVVPQNLVAEIPDSVSFEQASFTTVGTIAMQGIRQANPCLGESVCVIGLGLLGQLTWQMLQANGCRVMGIDIAEDKITLAQQLGIHQSVVRNDDALESAISQFTKGNGFDSVIITASAPTNDPMVLAGEILRKKGVVVVVGAVKMDIPRDPHYFRKELEVKLSCSYGPGRYDSTYEEKGNDYPYGYVRWTEQRNMQAFLQLITQGVCNVDKLITHTYPIDQAIQAYDIALGKKKEPFVGILLTYSFEGQQPSSGIHYASNPVKEINIGFIGAGNFAQASLLPHIKRSEYSLDTVITSTGINASSVAKKFSFNTASTNVSDIINNNAINTVFIATRHNTHASYIIEALNAGKHVFVEKPLAINELQLAEVIETYNKANENNKQPSNVLVGFNRRFSRLLEQGKEQLQNVGGPYMMQYRINAGFIASDHWIQDLTVGGGRIVGEVCHFIDCMQYITGSYPIRVFAETVISVSSDTNDNVIIILSFKDGSVGTISYVANGHRNVPKERFEVSANGCTFLLDNFEKATFYGKNKVLELRGQGKGHKQEIDSFLQCLRNGDPMPISFDSLCLTTLSTLKIVDSLRTGFPQEIDLRSIIKE